MSYDFATLKVCSHTIGPERLIMNEDQTFAAFVTTPVNNSVSVQIDGVEIPKSGLYTKAVVTFSNPEPYRIISGKNDLLSVRVGYEAPVTVQLPSGSSVRASEIVRTLSLAIPDLNFSVQNNRVTVSTSNQVRGTAFSFPDPRWTDKTQSLPSTARILKAMDLFGITPGRSGSGRKIFPGWSIVINPAAFYDEYIVNFDSPILNNSPILTVVYQTAAKYCRRCNGTRLEYDYTVTGKNYETVRNVDLLAQELDKFLYTRIGSHWKWRWMGSALVDRVGGKADTVLGTAAGMVSLDINQAFATYQNIKQQQNRMFPQQNVTDSEFPYSLESVNAYSDPNDPTTVVVKSVVKNRSRTYVPLVRNVSVPSPFQLTSDPTSMLKNSG